MMGRSAWPTILVVALLLSWLEPVPCAAPAAAAAGLDDLGPRRAACSQRPPHAGRPRAAGAAAGVRREPRAGRTAAGPRRRGGP